MSPAASLPMPVSPGADLYAGLHRFTADDFRAMYALGVLSATEPIELVEGYVVYQDGHAPPLKSRCPFPQWNGTRRWTIDEYHRLNEVGLLTTNDRMELLDGYMVQKMPMNRPHRSAVLRLSTRLSTRLPIGWVVPAQLPAVFPENEPEPDGMILPGVDSDYDDRDILPSDIAVVIEVSDSTLALDRGWKMELYATSGVNVYWIVNLVDRQIEVYTLPDVSTMPPTYLSRAYYTVGQDVPIVLDGVHVATIPVSELIP